MSAQKEVVKYKHFHIIKALELRIVGHEDIGLFTYGRSELNAVRGFKVKMSSNSSRLFGDCPLKGKQPNIVVIEEDISVLGGDPMISAS